MVANFTFYFTMKKVVTITFRILKPTKSFRFVCKGYRYPYILYGDVALLLDFSPEQNVTLGRFNVGHSKLSTGEI